MPLQTYNEDVERRSYLRSWCDIDRFHTDSERAVILAVRASSMREKARMMRGGKRRDEMLALIEAALPLDDPMVAHQLRDGYAAFNDRVADRIWEFHADELAISRCANCNHILKSPHARQCIWCGSDWHHTET